jgi:hypothetical protein
MAYVAARRNGRFEIRESVYTAKGPRAHSLASFEVLSDEVLARAEGRAVRPFDADAVIASGRRAGAEVAVTRDTPARVRGARNSRARFVQASRRMASTLERPPAPQGMDPGRTLIELLGFADAVRQRQQPRPSEALGFPPLERLAPRAGSAVSAR